MSSKNPNPEVEAAAAELRAGMEGLSDRQRAEATSALGSIGDKWWVLLVLGVISLVAGLLVVFNPNAAVGRGIALRCPRAVSSAERTFARVRSGVFPHAC